MFKCVAGSRKPWSSKEFKALQYLLTVFDDVFAREKSGMNVFDMIDDPTHWSLGVGSYQQDLWYCALYRAGLAGRFRLRPPISRPVFDLEYTIEHYCALLYLDNWESSPLGHLLASSRLPSSDIMSQRERETAPGRSQWDPSDLRVMEDRIRAFADDADDDDENY